MGPLPNYNTEAVNGRWTWVAGAGAWVGTTTQVRAAIFGLGDPSNFPIYRPAHQPRRSRMVMIYLFRSGLDDRMFCFSLNVAGAGSDHDRQA
jgi:hypothetical protein